MMQGVTAVFWAVMQALGPNASVHAQTRSGHNDMSVATPTMIATFNTRLLAFPVDVSLFAEDNPVPPGRYRVDVYVNQDWKGKHTMQFQAVNPDDRIAQPCFDASLLETLGFDLRHVVDGMRARLSTGQSVCAPLHQWIASAQSHFDVGLQRLNLTAPQIVLKRVRRDYVDPSYWDAGINAATLGYDYNVWHSQQSAQVGSRQTSHYLGLRAGVNLGSWRLRYRATVAHQRGSGTQYRSNALYAERALPSLRSALLVGESSTRSQVFDYLPFLGLRLESEMRMDPASRHGFAPVVSGIAQSNAKVSVRQHGVQIFETTVPPGPFVIDDLYPNGNGGDLLVTITEADGSEHRFTVAYASLPELLRPGVTRYSVAAGRYRSHGLVHEPLFGMVSVSHGLNNTVTGYGGALLAQGYASVSAGVGLNLPIGALTFDAAYARTRGVAQGVQNAREGIQGLGLRLAYTKRLMQTDINIAMLRYASRGYLDAAQAFHWRDAIQRGTASAALQQRRNQVSLSIYQPLSDTWGALSLSGSVQDYWQRHGRDVQYSLGYGVRVGSANVSVNAMRSRNTFTGRWDTQWLLSLSLPLGSSASRPMYLNTSLTQRPGSQTVQSSVSGTSGDQNSYGFNLYAVAQRSRGQALQTSGGASVNTTMPYARVSASVAMNPGTSRQLGMNIAGGAVLFRDGLVLTPELGETVGIVQAKNAAGVRLSSAAGTRLDARGHAVVSWLQPYRENDVSLDPKGISMDVELATTSQKVVPTDGAVVLLQYATHRGYAILVTGKRRDGSLLPFAAGVFDEAGQHVGYVAQGGRALVRVHAAHGVLTVRWGAQAGEQCQLHYAVDAREGMHTPDATASASALALRRVQGVCA